MPRPSFATVDAYLAAHPAPARKVLSQVRATLRKALPGSTEGISYQIPVYKLDGVMVLYFAGFQNHYSIYPATPRLVAALGKQGTPHLHNRATLRFSLTDPVPTQFISRVAKLRAEEALELAAAKLAKKRPAKKRPAKKRGTASETARAANGSSVKARAAKQRKTGRTVRRAR
jgi:uncharacterized protein YdhG (YjbR/CyaY superfamily)